MERGVEEDSERLMEKLSLNTNGNYRSVLDDAWWKNLGFGNTEVVH
jgi:hypothetical protein